MTRFGWVGVMCLGLGLASAAAAEEAFTYDFDGSFDDATLAVENAIVDLGLVIDYVSHVGEMLNRTGADLGKTEQVSENADIFLFHSANISRQVREANPLNITYCPDSIFVMETAKGVIVGHKDYPQGALQLVEDLMQQIMAEAIGS